MTRNAQVSCSGILDRRAFLGCAAAGAAAALLGEAAFGADGAAREPDMRSIAAHVLPAVVRLRMVKEQGSSWASATIINPVGGIERWLPPGTILLASAGHNFADWHPRASAYVHVFRDHDPQTLRPRRYEELRAELLIHNRPDPRKADVALLAIQAAPGAVYPQASVAHPERPNAFGDHCLFIGCVGEEAPSWHPTRVLSVTERSATHSARVNTPGAPAMGQSGGGLFAADGVLIGITSGVSRVPLDIVDFKVAGIERIVAASVEEAKAKLNALVPDWTKTGSRASFVPAADIHALALEYCSGRQRQMAAIREAEARIDRIEQHLRSAEMPEMRRRELLDDFGEVARRCRRSFEDAKP